jgi:hypothetical protein
MNPSELLLTANKIAESYLSSGKDLNEAIIRVASEKNLSKSQIERLVEETNKATLLTLLERKGEQEFPIANYEIIKSGLSPKIEKVASEVLTFTTLDYSKGNFEAQLGDKRIQEHIEKTSSDIALSEKDYAYIEALYKVAEDVWTSYNKFVDLEVLGQKRYGVKYSDTSDLVKVACEHNDKEIQQLAHLEQHIIKQGAVLEIIYGKMEKTASSLLWGETSPIKAAMKAGGSPFNRAAKAAGALINAGFKAGVTLPVSAAGGALKLGLKGAAVTAPVAIPLAGKLMTKNLNTTLTLGTEGSRAISHARQVAGARNYIGPAADLLKQGSLEKQAFLTPLMQGASTLFKTPLAQNVFKWGGRAMNIGGAVSKLTQDVTGKIGPGKVALASVEKNAGVLTGLQHALEFVTPALMTPSWSGELAPLGVFAGITSAAAKKLGGGIALTMNKKEFDSSFDTIMKNNPELAKNRQQVRGYFDVVSRHAPSLAKDPLVAESIIKNMNAFGGVDYNTVRGLRETEALGRPGPTEKGLSGLTAMFGRS